jgi:hypothetical protein
MAIAYGWSDTAEASSANVSSLQIDITGADPDEWVYCFFTKTKSGSTTLNGWDLVLQGDQNTNYHYALYRRLKVSDDTTFNITWSTSARALAVLIQWTGMDPIDPDEEAVAQFHTSGDTWTTDSATPSTATTWAATFTSFRTTNADDNSPSWTTSGLTQRVDTDTSAGSSPWVVALVADTNATVSEASHDYAHVADIGNSTGVSVLLYLITGGANATVNAVVATGSAQGEAPTVTATANVTATVMTATATAEAPDVAGEDAGSPIVSVPLSTASAQAEVPSLSAGATVTATPMTASAQGEIPALVGATVNVFTPPTRREHYGTRAQNPLTVRIGYPTGQTVIKAGGFYTTYAFNEVSDEMVSDADAAYFGGHDYVISDAEAAALTAAGYGSYITSRAQ